LPHAIGFLIEKELKELEKVKEQEKTIILGGAKVSDKIGVIKNLLPTSTKILVGGAMCATFLKLKGYEVGASLVSDDKQEELKELLNTDKIILPIDSVVSSKIGEFSQNKNNNEFDNSDIGLDIGINTIEKFKNILEKSKTVVWNGPLGYFEIDKYSNGTKQILELLSKLNITVIIGGGDTASAAINFGYKDSFTHISTGGGASLELLEGKALPGIEVIDEI